MEVEVEVEVEAGVMVVMGFQALLSSGIEEYLQL